MGSDIHLGASDQEIARFHGVIVGNSTGSSMVVVELILEDHRVMTEFPADMFDGKLRLYGQPIDCVVRVGADGFRYQHFEARPAEANPALPELERLLSLIK